jgi:hypothetical protein
MVWSNFARKKSSSVYFVCIRLSILSSLSRKNSNSCVRGRTDERKISTIISNIETNRFQFISPYRVIQQSHPVCNTIMLFGVITCLVSVILLGIDGQFVDPSTYPKVRKISNKNWLLYWHINALFIIYWVDNIYCLIWC